MALTRKMLTAMGIEAEKIDQIIEAHTESTEALKAKVEEAEEKAEGLRAEASKVPALEKQIEDMKSADESGEWKSKYEEAKADAERIQGDLDKLKGEKATLEGEFESYKQGVESERANAEKLELYKGLLREIGLDEKRVDKAARLKDMGELDVEDGALKDREELKKAEAEEWAEFIPQPTGKHGQNVPNPPKGQPTAEGADPEIAKMLKQRHADLFGKDDE